MITFKKTEWQSYLMQRDASHTRPSAPGDLICALGEIRWDPLLGYTVRITVKRRGQWDEDTELPDISRQVSNRATCPFCEPLFSSVVPGFFPTFSPTVHIQIGEAICFPNRYPYGTYSAVVIFSKDKHFISIGDFTPQDYRPAFDASLTYLSKVLDEDNQAHYQAITQNHLPSSGGSLIHPHLQVNADSVPTNFHTIMERALKAYAAESSSHYFHDLINEERNGDRQIADREHTFWLVPFAPAGQREVLGIIKNVSSLFDLSESAWEEIMAGIIAVQKFYRSLGVNSFNCALYNFPDPEGYYNVIVRMMTRSNYQPYPRNDMTYRETMLWEPSIEYYPEDMAQALKPYFVD